MIERGQLIELIGTTGSGKTTFAKDLGCALGAIALFEPTEGNPYLTDAHHGGEHSWDNQLWFLKKYVERLSKATQLIKDGKIVVIDSGLPTYILHTKLLIPDQSNRFNDLAARLTKYLASPDLTVYLRDTTDVLIERLKRRGKIYDDADSRFVGKLTQLHDMWAATATTPVISIRSRDLEHNVLKAAIIRKISLSLQATGIL